MTAIRIVLSIIRAARRAHVFRVAMSAAIDAATEHLAAELLAQINGAPDRSTIKADPYAIESPDVAALIEAYKREQRRQSLSMRGGLW